MRTEIQKLRDELNRKKGQRDRLQQDIDELKMKIRINKRNASRYERALEIAKQVGLSTQKQLEYHLSEQVSMAMEAVFDDPYKLKVNFQEKRGKTEVELLFTRRGLELPPMDNVGGGAMDVAALALRIAYWAMRRDKKVRPLLLLDEPFSRLKGVEANRRALGIIREISEQLNLQIIMISDERVSREDIIENADKAMTIRQQNDESKVEVLNH